MQNGAFSGMSGKDLLRDFSGWLLFSFGSKINWMAFQGTTDKLEIKLYFE